jgi:VanZ family protein
MAQYLLIIAGAPLALRCSLLLMRPAQRAARFLPLVAWMALVTYWSGQGNLPIDQPAVANVLHGFQHRIAHLAAFGLVGLLAWWAFAGVPRAALLAVLLTSVFGATDEWHQSFTPGRHSGIDDWAWDTACAVIGLFVWTRLETTRWHTWLRPLAPVVVGAMFVLGVGLALLPGAPLPSGVGGATLRSVTTQVAHRAIQLARSTRNVARQLRSTVAG